MAKKEDPAPPGQPPEPAPGPPRAPRPLTLQFGPTPSPPGSRLKQGRK